MSQVIGHGSQLEIDTTVPGTGIVGDTWVTVKGVLSIDLGSDKVDTHDNTAMDTSGTDRTFIGGLKDSGDLSAKINVYPGDTTQTALFTARDGGVHYFKVVYPGAVRTVLFQGIITAIDESVPDDKLPTYSVKIKITGGKTVS